MAKEMREDAEMKGIHIKTSTRIVLVLSHKDKQQDNKDYQLLMFIDYRRSTITTSAEQIKSAKENVYTYQKSMHIQMSMKVR